MIQSELEAKFNVNSAKHGKTHATKSQYFWLLKKVLRDFLSSHRLEQNKPKLKQIQITFDTQLETALIGWLESE